MRHGPSTRSGRLFLLSLEGWRALGGLIAFVLAAKTFGLKGYGMLISAYAIAAIALPLIGQGTVDLAVRSGATGTAAAHLKRSLRHVLPISPVVAAIAGVGFTSLRGLDAGLLVALIVLAETGPAYAIAICSAVCLGSKDLRRAATRGGLPLLIRVASLALLSPTHPTAEVWAAVNLGVVSVVSLVVARRTMRWTSLEAKTELGAWRDSSFGVNDSLLTVSNNADTLLLGFLQSAESAGLYGAQYRLAQYCLIPTRALLTANLSLLYHAGNLSERWRLARTCAFRSFIATSAVALVAGCLGPFIRVLGSGFRFDLRVYALLAIGFSLRGISFSFGDVWTVEGKQRVRTKLQSAATVLTVVLYVALILPFGPIGAAAATVLGEVIFISLMSATRTSLKELHHDAGAQVG